MGHLFVGSAEVTRFLYIKCDGFLLVAECALGCFVEFKAAVAVEKYDQRKMYCIQQTNRNRYTEVNNNAICH